LFFSVYKAVLKVETEVPAKVFQHITRSLSLDEVHRRKKRNLLASPAPILQRTEKGNPRDNKGYLAPSRHLRAPRFPVPEKHLNADENAEIVLWEEVKGAGTGVTES